MATCGKRGFPRTRSGSGVSGRAVRARNSTGIQGVSRSPSDSADREGFWKWGRLESVGTPQNHIRYLKFRDGPYWLKAGCDDPENFLGKAKNFDTLEKRKAAIDYLASRGINSLYMMVHNIGGDDNDVWPWLGDSPKEAKKHGGSDARFDVAKLEQWCELFEYMQTKGVVPYLILEDDSAWKGYDHARYYREMVARFGYLPALLFNIGEEQNENYRLAEALDLARQLREVDPFNHPCGLHNVNTPDDAYVDALPVSFTSIQTGSPDGEADRSTVTQSIDNRLDRKVSGAKPSGADDWLRRGTPRTGPSRVVECLSRRRRMGSSRAPSLRSTALDLGKSLDRTGRHSGVHGVASVLEDGAEQRSGCRGQSVLSGGAWGYLCALFAAGEGRSKSSWQNRRPIPFRGGILQTAAMVEFTESGNVEGGRRRFTAPGKGDWALRIAAVSTTARVESPSKNGLTVDNGWYAYHGKAIWGYGQHNGWWRPGQRPNLARNAPGEIGPNRTEDLDKLTDSMLRFGYPAFEHNYGLWYDRRRDRHDAGRRADAKVVPPFLEQPWDRSNGRLCVGWPAEV